MTLTPAATIALATLPCPVCNALPGEHCQDIPGQPTYPHLSRTFDVIWPKAERIETERAA